MTLMQKEEMATIPSIFSSEAQSPGSPKKTVNGDTRSFFLSRQSSKKKIKWSFDKRKSDSSPVESEKNRFNDNKPKLASKSASSFFSTKSEIPRTQDDEDLNGTSFSDSNDNRNSADLERQSYKDDSRWVDDDGFLMAMQDKNLARASTGSINFVEKLVQEILSSEKTYVNNIREIIEGYLKCMHMKNCPITKENVKHLFINIEKIYEFNREFLNQIENADEDPVEIADCFVKNEIGFQTYTEYCTNYPKSVEILTECTRQREAATFIQEIQMNLGHSLPLGSYLLKPVQRILKYHLLLQEMKKRFDKTSDEEGFGIICDALFAMTHVAQYINEMKRQHEATLHVQEIQSQLSEFEGPDLTTYGNLVLEDLFRVMGTRTDRYLFLFEKILLITKKREREHGYTCKASLLLSNMMMTESLPKEPLAFQIIRFDNQKVTYPFMARSMEQKDKWTLALKKLLVESLVAVVPLKAKALILGERNVDEDCISESGSPKKPCSPATTRRQSVKDSLLSSPSADDSLKRIQDNAEDEVADIKRPWSESVDDSDLSQGMIKPLKTVDISRLSKKSPSNSEGILLFDRYASLSDLRSRAEGRMASNLAESDLDIAKQLSDITENSKIHRTVREVARAFSSSEYSENVVPNSPRFNMTSEGRGLDDLLESIDRELDETRRTINSAQLLESAVKLKQFKPLNISWPKAYQSESEKNGRISANKNIEGCEIESPSVRSCALHSTQNQDVCKGDEEERDIKAEIAAFQKQSPKMSQFFSEKNRTCSLDRRRNKKVFELSPRTNRFSTGNVDEHSDQRRTVHEMARQYSRKIKDDKAVEIRSRAYSNNSESKETIKASQPMKIERVTKVKFDSSLNTSGVVRRRQKSGGSRHNRSSWSHEDGKVDVDLLRLKIERPRSLHEIKPQKELIDVDCKYLRFTDELDEGLAPALLAGMEKDDVVVRGLVKHLIGKFGDHPKTGSQSGTDF